MFFLVFLTAVFFPGLQSGAFRGLGIAFWNAHSGTYKKKHMFVDFPFGCIPLEQTAQTLQSSHSLVSWPVEGFVPCFALDCSLKLWLHTGLKNDKLFTQF